MKKLIACGGLVSTIILLGVGLQNNVKANITNVGAEVNELKVGAPVEQNNKNNLKSKTAATKQLMREAEGLSRALSYNMYYAGEFPLLNVIGANSLEAEPYDFEDTTVAKVNSDMSLREGKALAANTSTLDNTTGKVQMMKTPSFRYTKSDSVKTSSTHSTGTSLTTTAKMSFPIASGEMSMEVHYDYSTTKERESNTEVEWSVPSQEIEVPAGKTYKVEWLLKTGIATGTTNLTSQVKALIPYKYIPGDNLRETYGYADAVNVYYTNYKNKPKAWHEGANYRHLFTSRNVMERIWGTARYKAEYGTEFIMKVSDVSKPSSPIFVKTIPVADLSRTIIG